MRYQITKHKYLNESELNALKQLVNNDKSRNGLLLRLALKTGARAMELLNITKIDLDDRHCSVFIKGLKGSNSREIPIGKELYNDIKAYSSGLESERIFPISYERLVDIWEYYRPCKKKFQALRHTFAIELYKRTRDLLLVQAALGHRNFNNTLVYCEHIDQTERLKKLNRI